MIKIMHSDGPWDKPGDLSEATALAKATPQYIVSPVTAARYIEVQMRDKKAHLGGVYCTPNEGQAMNSHPTNSDAFILGDLMVIDPASTPRFDELMTLKEDYDLTAQHLAKYGAVARSNRVVIRAAHYTNAGGAVADRTDSKEQYNIGVLRHKWPGVFPQHNTRGVNEVNMRWRSRSDILGGKKDVPRPECPVWKETLWKGELVTFTSDGYTTALTDGGVKRKREEADEEVEVQEKVVVAVKEARKETTIALHKEERNTGTDEETGDDETESKQTVEKIVKENEVKAKVENEEPKKTVMTVEKNVKEKEVKNKDKKKKNVKENESKEEEALEEGLTDPSLIGMKRALEVVSPNSNSTAKVPRTVSKPKQSEDISFGTKVEGGLKRAEKKAKEFMDSRGGLDSKFTLTHALEVLSLLGADCWPTQTRPNVVPEGQKNKDVRGMCLGLVYGLGGLGMKMSKVSEFAPYLTSFVNAVVADTLPEPDFKWSSIQINYSYAARKHVDGNNLGPSYIAAVGEHTGGGLWTEDRGVVEAKDKWALFNGTKLHETQPFEGERISLIVFTHNACEEIKPSLVSELRRAGFTAGSSERIRDEGDVVEEHFDALWRRRLVDCPPRSGDGAVAVECAGWACGRGSAWVSYREAKGTKKQSSLASFFGGGKKQAAEEGEEEGKTSPGLPRGLSKIDFTKNSTGIHCVELCLDDKGTGFRKIKQHRFKLYDKLDEESKHFCEWVQRLPVGQVILMSIADSAIAKSRPLPSEFYDALRLLGAPDPDSCEVIGYRNPFCGIFIKGGSPGEAAFGLDKHAQSKTIIRLEAKVVRESCEGGKARVRLVDVRDTRTLATDVLYNGKAPKAVAKVGGKLVFSEEDVQVPPSAGLCAK